MSDTEHIIEEVLSGAINRYEEVIALFQQDVWRVVAAARLGPTAAEELVHRTFVNAYQHLRQYRRGTNFQFWLKAIARNLVRNRLRRQVCRTKYQQLYREHVLALLESDADVPDDENPRVAALRECLGKLAANYREVVRLRYEKGFSLKKIAELANETATAVKQRLWRARLALRDCIEAAQP
ncbi:MAG: sigma-70 family RNA polymerase sigma factor [Kiritimatiellae bacterium]|nr:sigma-70 family RNA polymerase sigma factor [Kiritimatiellia bacterium]